MNLVRYNTVDSNGDIVAGRELSASLWRNLREKFILGSGEPQLGVAELDDFGNLSPNTTDATVVEGYKMQNSAAGGTGNSFQTTADVKGVGRLTATTGTDWFGASVARVNKNFNTPKHSSDPKGDCAVGVRVDLSAADHYFIGYGEETEEFLGATGALPADSDYIGFFREDGGDLKFVCANDNAGGTAVTDEVTIVAAADLPADYTKLEFRVNKDFSVEIAVGGVLIKRDTSGNAIVIDPDAIPIETLNFIAEAQRGATGDLASVTLDFDWRAVCVEF